MPSSIEKPNIVGEEDQNTILALERASLVEREAEDDINSSRIENKRSPIKFDELCQKKIVSNEAARMLENSPVAQEAIESMSKHDYVTTRHLIAMVNLAAKLAREEELLGNNFSEENKKFLLEAAATHDIGKEWINEQLLNKKGVLGEEDKDKLKEHPLTSGIILDRVKHRTDLADIAVMHHAMQKNAYPSEKEIEVALPGHFMRRNPQQEKIAKLLVLLDRVDSSLSTDRAYKTKEEWPDAIKTVLKKEYPEQENVIDFLVDNWQAPKSWSK